LGFERGVGTGGFDVGLVIVHGGFSGWK
jgi:hypothetical protein